MTTVLFACVQNAGRSQMAAALFNQLADPARARAISAGTDPGARVHREVVDAMRELDTDLSNAIPAKLTPELAQRAQVLITMGCGDECPLVPGATRDDWPVEDPKGKPLARVRAIRDHIRERVETLIQSNGWSRSGVAAASRIRLASEADAAAIAAIYRPIVESTTISFETQAPDENEMRKRISETLEMYPWLVYERDGAVVGYAYASRHRVRAAYQWSVDASAYVDGRLQRRGIGRALYTSLVAILRAQGLVNVFAGIALPNVPSIALHEAVGFEPIGVFRNVGYKFGAWRDVGWWQLALREYDAQPPVLRSLADVRDDEGWEGLLRKGLDSILVPR